MAGQNCTFFFGNPAFVSLICPRPQYAPYDIDTEGVKGCLGLAKNAIVIASWLVAIARRELARFREFIKWLSFGKYCDELFGLT
jgi:hypothetical protein